MKFIKITTLLAAICIAFTGETQNQTIYCGMAYGGDSLSDGILYKYDLATFTESIPYQFYAANGISPRGNLMQASNGLFYGMTLNGGGMNTYGTLFSFDPLKDTCYLLQQMSGTNGWNPHGSLIQASNGKLYGMTIEGGTASDGNIFSYNIHTNSYKSMASFNNTNGWAPYGSMVEAPNGLLYGMTNLGGAYDKGVIFSFDTATSAITDLYDFNGTYGENPYGSLIVGSNGKLYGMAYTGGANNAGVIFSFNPAGNVYAKLYDFNNTNGRYPYGDLTQAPDGLLYGLTLEGGNYNHGVIFSLDTGTHAYTDLYEFDVLNGQYPYGNLTLDTNGLFYGMTKVGGAHDSGIVFSFNPVSKILTDLVDFNDTNGSNPWGSLTISNGLLYGMTFSGGVISSGTIFDYDITANKLNNLFDFNSLNGYNPCGTVIQATNGLIYGMTTHGGLDNSGVIYSYDPVRDIFKNYDVFNDSAGANPYGSLMQASNGLLYGMTYDGGGYDEGVIFSFDPVTAQYKRLYVFTSNSNSGMYPLGNLIQASNGLLYGMTSFGGIIFSFDPVSNTFMKLVSFNGTNGSSPLSSLFQAANGKLYGTTESGGTYTSGVLFSYDIGTNILTDMVDFQNGDSPYSNFIQGSNGLLYTNTNDGGIYNYGDILSLDTSTSVTVDLYNFTGAYGEEPTSGLAQDANGIFYGVTSEGGINNVGVLYRYNPFTGKDTNLIVFNGANGTNTLAASYPGVGLLVINSITTSTKQLSVVSNHPDSYQESVFPNPSGGIFTFQSSMVSGHPDSYRELVEVYNVLGEKVYTQFIAHSSSFIVDLRSQPSGVYFYRVISLDGAEIGSGKLVISH